MAVNPSSTPTSSYLLLLIQSIKRLNLILSLRKYTERGHNKDQMQEMYIDADNI